MKERSSMNEEQLAENEKGRIDSTLTVGELINILEKYPRNKKILITWESTLNELKKEFIYEAKTGTLYLDADYGFYKKDYAKDPEENK